jgi:hypothetical protein
MKTDKISLDKVKPAPWRFSENRAQPYREFRQSTPILDNIIRSLEKDGQFAPIHVRPMPELTWEILDGHIVVDAARQLGLKELDAIVHADLNDEAARLRYFHFNLNRCGQYGHYHVKIHRVFADMHGDTATDKAAIIVNHVSWPGSRVRDYVELDEQGANWQKFMLEPDRDEEDEAHVPDYR